MDTLVDEQMYLQLYPAADWQPLQVSQNWCYPLELPGDCDEARGGILHLLQFVKQLTTDSSKDAATVVEPTPNKRMNKCFCRLSRSSDPQDPRRSSSVAE